VSPRQRSDLEAALPEFDCHAGSMSGPPRFPALLGFLAPLLRRKIGAFLDEGEPCPIFLRRDRLRAVTSGSFHTKHSEGPAGETFRSPHVVNWVHAEDVRTGLRVTVHSTHLGLLPWRGAATARNLLSSIAANEQPGPKILCGDFNSYSFAPAVGTLLNENHRPRFRDGWRIAERRRGRDATFRMWWGVPDPRIDYVFVTPEIRVIEAETIVGDRDGRMPSDHSALRVDLAIEG
jgi:hypothetical protein